MPIHCKTTRQIVAAGATLLALQAHAASFDCAKASTRVETTICADPALGKLDDDVATAYAAAGDGLDDSMRKRLARSQREWLRIRSTPRDLAGDMKMRLRQLQHVMTSINGVRFLQLVGDKRPMFVLSAAPGAAAYNHWADSVWEANSHDLSPRAAEGVQAKCVADNPATADNDCMTESVVHAYRTSVPGPGLVSVYEWRSVDLQAAHPMDETHHFNWWLSRPGQVTSADIFAGDAYKAVIARSARDYVQANGGEAPKEAVDSVTDPDAWGLFADGMHLSGDGYTFRAGRGEFEITIPWRAFGSSLRRDFEAALSTGQKAAE